MNVACLLKLRPGERLLHTPTNNPAVVMTPATPSRRYGYRVQVRGAHSTTWITTTNISDWARGG